MRTTIRRWFAIAAVILLSLTIALSLLAVATQEAFAFTSAHTSSDDGYEHWFGEGNCFNSSCSPFLMDLKITVTGQDFTGIYYTATYDTTLDIQGYYASGGGLGYGAFAFTSKYLVSGNPNVCVGCSYNADFTVSDQTAMRGSWVWPDGSSGGNFFLSKTNN